MRLYPWSWTRTFSEATQTYHYTVTYEANMQGSVFVETLNRDPEAEMAAVRELSEALINHISLEMERHRALAPDLLDKTTNA